MFGKVGARVLVLAVVALLLLYGLSEWFGVSGKQRTFRAHVLQLDTAAVTAVRYEPRRSKGGEIRLARSGTEWTVAQGERTFPADARAVGTMLGHFALLRSERMAGSLDAVKEKRGLADSLAVPVTFTLADGSEKQLLVGQGSTASGHEISYVNVPGEEEVYAVEGLLDNKIDVAVAMWRPRSIVKGDPDAWQKLTFTFPGDSSYTLQRVEGQWLVDSLPGDSARINNFLKSLARSTAHDFADSADVSLLTTPAYLLEIQDRSLPTPILVKVFPWQQGYVATSTVNPGNVMRFDAYRELPRMFRPRVNWLAQPPPAATPAG